MPHFKKFYPSTYLQAADLDVPIIVTINAVAEEKVGVGEDADDRPVATFREDVKPMVLNFTRADAIAEIVGDPDTDAWPGTRIRISRGLTTFKGKRVACMVVDAPPKAKSRRAPDPVETGEPDDIDQAMQTLKTDY